MQKTIAILVPLILASLAPQAKADAIIYDNLASTTYNAGFGEALNFASVSLSTSFVAGTTGNLGEILVPIYFNPVSSTNSPDFNFSLTDSSNNVLESWTGLTAPNGEHGNVAISVVDIASVMHPLLTSDDTYNLIASINSARTTFDVWDEENSINNNQVGFRVVGTPEPASLTLLGTALAAFGGFHLRRWRCKPSTT
jgi:hypothetical protein